MLVAEEVQQKSSERNYLIKFTRQRRKYTIRQR